MINIKADSRKIIKGDTFIALRGISSDGHDYIDAAIKNGASKLIVEEDKNYSIPYEAVKDTREYLVKYLTENYSYIFDDMTIIGITGTNGKTTSAYLLYTALNNLHIKCAYIGTVGYFLEEGKVMNLPNTSPDICDMYDLIIGAYDKGYKHIVIEASSQGLYKGRFEGIKFDYAIFTNLTQDHLDDHKTMENYAKAKQLLFKKLKSNGKSIVNYDDPYKTYFETKDSIMYGFKGGDYRVKEAIYNHNNTIFKYAHNNETIKITSPLLGDYNVYNLLTSIIVLDNLNIDLKDIISVIKTLKCPSGRMDTIIYKNNSIIVDYAHTPDAIEKILSTVKKFAKNNIYVVFGCTGDRDRTKRPIMTKLVTDNSTYAVITMDDLHNEEFSSIISDMTEGIKNTNYEIIEDRGKAIEKGMSLLKKNDILLILGKGHEEAIIIKDKRVPFNDMNYVNNLISQNFQ